MPVPHRCSMPITGWPTCVTRSGSARPSPPPAPPTAPSSRSARTHCSPRRFPTPSITRLPATHITTASARCSAMLTTPSNFTPTSTPPTPSGHRTVNTSPSRTPPSRSHRGATPGIGSTSHPPCPPTALGSHRAHRPLAGDRQPHPGRLAVRADLARPAATGDRHCGRRPLAGSRGRRPGCRTRSRFGPRHGLGHIARRARTRWTTCCSRRPPRAPLSTSRRPTLCSTRREALSKN